MNLLQMDLVARAAATHGDAPAAVDRVTGRRLDFLAVEKHSRQLAAALARAGIRRGEIVACHIAEPFQLWLLLLALLRMGCVAAPLSTRLPQSAARERADMLGATHFLDHAPQEVDEKSFPELGADFSRPATLVFTSGSTGEPKAAAHSLTAHFAAAQASAANIPFRPGHRWLVNLPMYHVSGLSLLFRSLAGGGALVFPSPDETNAQAAQAENATHLSVVSPQLTELLAEESPPKDLLAVLAGGGPLPRELVEQAVASGIPLHLTYGMTEAASQICTSIRLTKTPSIPHCGHPLTGVKVRIAGDGEIQIQSPSLMLGYHRKGGEPERPWTEDGWFPTGDLGHHDADGNLIVTGRKDRRFVSGGENIHPEEIERALESLPEIERVFVVPQRDEIHGMRPCAFVFPHNPASVPHWSAALREYLPGFMIPVVFHPWPDEIDPKQAKLPAGLFSERAEVLRQVS